MKSMIRTTVGLSALALAAIAPSPANAQSVTAGPIINPSNGHHYYLVSASSWTAAATYAEQALGGQLVTINNATENEWVRATFSPLCGCARLWIGLNDAAQEGSFVWRSGQPVGYTNWAGGQPDNNAGQGPEEDGVEMGLVSPLFAVPGTWNDLFDAGAGNYSVVEVETPAPSTDPALKLLLTGRFSGSINDVWLANSDGSGLVNLTADFADSVDTAFLSPSGEFVAFLAQPASGSAHIWIMKADGSEKRQLTFVNHQFPQCWGWLSNTEVLFRWAPGPSQGDVYTVNISTGAMTLVLDSHHAGLNQASIDTLAISPDRTKLAFTAQSGSNSPTSDVYTYDLSATDPLAASAICPLYLDNPDTFQDQLPQWFDNDTVFWSHNANAGLSNNFQIVRKDVCAPGSFQAVTSPIGTQLGLRDLLPEFGKMLVVHPPQNYLSVIDFNSGTETTLVPMITGTAEWGIVAGQPVGCDDIDFNNDGFYPDTMDIDAFLSVFSGGPCLY